MENRIKPNLLRDQKTEALLVFIRTTLEEHFNVIKKDNETSVFGSKEDTDYIYKELNKLLNNLQIYTVNAKYLQTLIANSGKNNTSYLLALKEKPLMVYYDSLAIPLEKNILTGQDWIPEVLVISLLSNWVLEEEKSTHLYKFLDDLDYLKLTSIFDKAKSDESKENKKIVMDMYNISIKLIESLKKCSYSASKKKARKKKR